MTPGGGRGDDEGQVSEGQVSEGQVSEVAGLEQAGAGEEITPGDATAGYPTENDAQRPQEGTAGPNAAPRHDPPEDSNESSR